jgi:hypothetical protein
MIEIYTFEQTYHQRRPLFGTAVLTIAVAGLVTIVAAATLGTVSPAFAQQHATRLKGLEGFTPAPRTQLTVDRNDPALTGGGSLGYNQRVEQGF